MPHINPHLCTLTVPNIVKNIIPPRTCIEAVAVFVGPIHGAVTFHQCIIPRDPKGCKVCIRLSGMKPGATHAIHIHEYGDEREGCLSLGGHWNPEGTTHGSFCLGMVSHAGDMVNNITADSHGKVEICYTDQRITLQGDISESIIGRSVVIHDGIDDLGLGENEESLKTGNAGHRLACAIIGHSKL